MQTSSTCLQANEFEWHGTPYLVMQYTRGGSLQNDFINRGR
jgi:serine/threonine protein kinase